MKKLKLSPFDLGIIIAAVVIALLGGGAWLYLSGQLAAAQTDVTNAKAAYDKLSVYKSPRESIIINAANQKTLQNNIDLLREQLEPLIADKLQSKENKLSSITTEDPVAWKHDLDDTVQRLNAAAKTRNVAIPKNFYYGFGRYRTQSPNESQTTVLSKQMTGIEALANILIASQVKSIKSIRRTYEENGRSGGGGGGDSEASSDTDHLAGSSFDAPGNDYTSYPFQVEFETTSEELRTVTTGLIQSPYVFVARAYSIENSQPNSPQLNVLDQMAGPPPGSVTDTSPGEVAATTSTKGPQYLFGGNSTITVKLRVEMIEWKAALPAENAGSAHDSQNKTPVSRGGN